MRSATVFASSTSRHVFQQKRELVAAEAGDGVRGAQALLHALGHLRQEPVAGGVSEAVIDALEVVEIHEQYSHRVRCRTDRARARARGGR